MNRIGFIRFFLISILFVFSKVTLCDEVRVSSYGTLRLNQGFHSHKETGTNGCLIASDRLQGQAVTTLKIHQPLSDVQLQEILIPDTEASLNFQSSSAGSLQSWLSEHSNTPTKILLRYLVKIGGREGISEPVSLTEQASALSRTDLQRFLASCGDRYISRIEYGGYLLMAISFQFRSNYLAARFNRDANFELTGIEEFSEKIAYALREFKDRVMITVSARQVGGDAGKLNRILQNGSIYCHSGNLGACSRLGENLIEYLTMQGGFYDQINKEAREQRLSPIIYYARPYSDLPELSTLNPTVPPSATSAKQSILRDLHSTLGDQASLNRIDLSQENDESRLRLQQIREKIDYNYNVIQSSLERCQASFSDCVSQKEILTRKLKPYDPSLLIPSLTFIDYCLESGANKTSVNTVKALRQLPGLGRTNCFDDFQQLNSFSTMDLSGQDIVDIQPLKGFKTLQALDLRHNQIQNLDGIQSLTNLKELDLSFALATNDVKKKFFPDSLRRLGLWGNNLNQNEILREFQLLDELLVTHESVCNRELKWMLDQSMIDQNDFDFWSSHGFGPGWKTYRRQPDGFFRCPLVSRQYRLLEF